MDANYQTFSYRLANGGLVARYVYDKVPPGSFRNLQNLESRAEGAISSRYGRTALSNAPLSGLGVAVNTVARMKSLASSFRYGATTVGVLSRIAGDAAGAFANIASNLSGNRMSMYPYRPSGNASPYMFIADAIALLKDNGTGNPENWGLNAPTRPVALTIGDPKRIVIETFDEANAASFAFASVTGTAIGVRVQGVLGTLGGATGLAQLTEVFPGCNTNGMVRTANVVTVTCPSPHGWVSGMKIAVVNPLDTSFNTMGAIITVTSPTVFTYPNVGPNAASGVNAGGFFNVNTTGFSASPSWYPGMLMTIDSGLNQEVVMVLTIVSGGFSGFTASVTKQHNANMTYTDSSLQGTVAANTQGTVSKNVRLNLDQFGTPQHPVGDDDVISFYVKVSDPAAIAEMRLIFDVGDGTFTHDYYYKSVSASTWQPAVTGNLANGDIMTRRVFDRAAARADNRRLGYIADDLAPADLPELHGMRPFELNTGKAAWTQVQVRRSEFVAVGNAGKSNNTWANVAGWQVSIKTQPNSTVTVSLDDMQLMGGSGLDSFNGKPYDYRITYWNNNTGLESNPCPTLATSAMLTPRRQPIQVSFNQTQGVDPQVTHWNIYRRGGTLTQSWYFVARVPIATTTYTDTADDATVEINDLLQINNYPPVNTLLQVPVITTMTITSTNGTPGLLSFQPAGGVTNFFNGQEITIGDGANLESVVVDFVDVPNGIVTVYSNVAHFNGDAVRASMRPNTPMNLMAIAFDKAWLAGDPNNPHILYYSKSFSPEIFPVTNSLEIGTPDAPIMGLLEHRGMLFVFTTKRIYQVLGAGSAIPTVIPTGARHGLVAQFAWAAAENVIYYLSYDGIYMFTGSGSSYMTERIEWLFTGKNLGPVPPVDTSNSQAFMAYGNHELFVNYRDINGNFQRLIYHDVYQRWRNANFGNAASVFSMNFEEDTGSLIVGAGDGFVYLDRVGDTDAGIPIPIALQTAQLDQDVPKAFKVYNEFTLDVDTAGQTLNVSLLFNNGTTTLPLGTVNTVGRQQVQFNINAGDGFRSLNVGLLVTGLVSQAVTFYETHVRAIVEAESRQSFDSYWVKYGSDEWKVIKQGWFEYAAPDPGGVLFAVYTEGNMAAPAFTFTLPSSANRRTQRVRFPANKATMYRWVAISAADFQFYNESQVEAKPVGSTKGYAKQKLATGAA